MSESLLLNMLLSLVGALLGLLICILGWIGGQLVARLDALVKKLGEVSDDLHNRISGLDNRLTVVETKIEVQK